MTNTQYLEEDDRQKVRQGLALLDSKYGGVYRVFDRMDGERTENEILRRVIKELEAKVSRFEFLAKAAVESRDARPDRPGFSRSDIAAAWSAAMAMADYVYGGNPHITLELLNAALDGAAP